MKKLISTLAVALLALSACTLSAQTYGYANLSLTGIGTTATNATTTCTNLTLDVRYFQNVTLQTKFCFADATTSNVVYTISKSLDKTNWDTTGTTWTVAGNGTNDVIASTTIATGGAGWLKLVSIQNTDPGIVLTNKLFRYSIKRGAP